MSHQNKVASTPFSRFIRYASTEQKKKVYLEVLKGASERQRVVIEKAKSL